MCSRSSNILSEEISLCFQKVLLSASLLSRIVYLMETLHGRTHQSPVQDVLQETSSDASHIMGSADGHSPAFDLVDCYLMLMPHFTSEQLSGAGFHQKVLFPDQLAGSISVGPSLPAGCDCQDLLHDGCPRLCPCCCCLHAVCQDRRRSRMLSGGESAAPSHYSGLTLANIKTDTETGLNQHARFGIHKQRLPLFEGGGLGGCYMIVHHGNGPIDGCRNRKVCLGSGIKS
jgi:hypothetical protein